MPSYWLMKSEPSEVSVDDVLAARNATVPWTGVRNYQARNFMRDPRNSIPLPPTLTLSPNPNCHAGCWSMLLLKKGSRLSITPVEPRHWHAILQRLESQDA